MISKVLLSSFWNPNHANDGFNFAISLRTEGACIDDMIRVPYEKYN